MVRIMTLNAHSWIEEHQLEKIAAIVDYIAQEDIDIIGLQEVNQSHSAEVVANPLRYCSIEHKLMRIKRDNFALLIVQKLEEIGLNYYWSWHTTHVGYEIYDEGIAILSKSPIVAREELVSVVNDFESYHTRRALYARTKIGNYDWLVISSHYSWWLSDHGDLPFKTEWDNTVKGIWDEEKLLPIAIMGDFNNAAGVRDEGYDYVITTTPWLKDSYLEARKKVGKETVVEVIAGWPDGKRKRIDYIFLANVKQVDRYEVVFDGVQTPLVSDHLGVVIDAEIYSI